MLELRTGTDGTVYLSGRLDAAQSEKAERVLRTLSASTVVDCSELEYISSAGIGLLVATYKRLQDSGHSFQIINADSRIRNVLRYAGLDKLLLAD